MFDAVLLRQGFGGSPLRYEIQDSGCLEVGRYRRERREEIPLGRACSPLRATKKGIMRGAQGTGRPTFFHAKQHVRDQFLKIDQIFMIPHISGSEFV